MLGSQCHRPISFEISDKFQQKDIATTRPPSASNYDNCNLSELQLTPEERESFDLVYDTLNPTSFARASSARRSRISNRSGSSNSIESSSISAIPEKIIDQVSKTTASVSHQVSDRLAFATKEVSKVSEEFSKGVLKVSDQLSKVSEGASKISGDLTEGVSNFSRDFTIQVASLSDEITNRVSKATGEISQEMSKTTEDMSNLPDQISAEMFHLPEKISEELSFLSGRLGVSTHAIIENVSTTEFSHKMSETMEQIYYTAAADSMLLTLILWTTVCGILRFKNKMRQTIQRRKSSSRNVRKDYVNKWGDRVWGRNGYDNSLALNGWNQNCIEMSGRVLYASNVHGSAVIAVDNTQALSKENVFTRISRYWLGNKKFESESFVDCISAADEELRNRNGAFNAWIV